MEYKNIYKFIIFYLTAIFFLYISILLSYLKYSGFMYILTIIPIVFSIIFIIIGGLFIFNKNYKQPGFILLLTGSTLLLYGFISFYFSIYNIIWESSIFTGIIFITFAIINLAINSILIYKRRYNKM